MMTVTLTVLNFLKKYYFYEKLFSQKTNLLRFYNILRETILQRPIPALL